MACQRGDDIIEELSANLKLNSQNRDQWAKRIEDHILHFSTSEGDSSNRVAGHGGHKLKNIETVDDSKI